MRSYTRKKARAMKTETDFAKRLTAFMGEYLPQDRKVSVNTLSSYKVAFINFISFMREQRSINLNQLRLKHLTRDNVLDYLRWIETDKHVSPATRNYRLAAIKSFCKFLQYKDVELLAQWQSIMSISKVNTETKALEYLTQEGVKLLLEQPDQSTVTGRRHLALLALMYDTAARVQEIADLTRGSLRIDSVPHTIKIIGKGNKARIVPVSKEQALLMKEYISENRHILGSHTSPLFQNARGEKLTREGIAYILRKYVDMARCINPEIIPARVSPHSIRHSRAMHLLHEGAMHIVDLRDFLGHSSIMTTGIYARADAKTKREALEKAYSGAAAVNSSGKWQNDKSLLEWLKQLGR